MDRGQSQSVRGKQNGVLNREGGFQKKNNLHLSLFPYLCLSYPNGQERPTH